MPNDTDKTPSAFVTFWKKVFSSTLFIWLLWNFLFVAMPTFWLLMYLIGRPLCLQTFVRQGEFALYGVSVVLATIYYYMDGSADGWRRHHTPMNLSVLGFAFALLSLCVILYIKSASRDWPVDGSAFSLYAAMTIGGFVLCGVYGALVVHFKPGPVDPAKSRQADDKRLESDFDSLGK